MSDFPEIWFRGLSKKDKDDLINLLVHSDLSKRMVEILESYLAEVEKISRKDYDNPSWAFKQAHTNGEIYAYEKILTLLRPTERK